MSPLRVDRLTLAPFLLAGLCACSSALDSEYFGKTVPQHPADILWINGGGSPQFIDPALVHDSVGSQFARNQWARLVEISTVTGMPIPDLATHWDISKDRTEYIFYLREDATWSDGKPLTAHDVEWSWKRVLNPSTGATSGSLANVFMNAEAFSSRSLHLKTPHKNLSPEKIQSMLETIAPIDRVEKALGDVPGYFVFVGGEPEQLSAHRDQLIKHVQQHGLNPFDMVSMEMTRDDVVQVKALDDHRIWAKLIGPLPYFLSMLDYHIFAPVPAHAIEAAKKKTGREELWTRPEHVVVSGPYKLIEEKFKQYRILEKNPLYYDAKYVKTPKVKVLVIEDYNASLYVYRTGGMDWAGSNVSVPAFFADDIKKYKDYRLTPQLVMYYYYINVANKPMDNKWLRKALSLAIDRKAIVEKVTRAGQLPSANLIPCGLAGYTCAETELFNPEKAKQYLKKAGFSSANKVPTLEIKYNTAEEHRKIAEAIQQMWKKYLGIDVSLVNEEWRVFLHDRKEGFYQISRGGWIGDYPDPQNFLQLLLSDSTANITNWKNTAFDQLMHSSDREGNVADRLKQMNQAEAIALEESPIIPVYVYTKGTIKKPYLMGHYDDLQDYHPWKYMWIDARWYKEVPQTRLDETPYKS
ncbi:MAG: peptide ABC transporter substrate-binding protein [Bdellovibrionota bacterium]